MQMLTGRQTNLQDNHGTEVMYADVLSQFDVRVRGDKAVINPVINS